MITLTEAKNLKPGDILVDSQNKRWKVNGQVITWKTDSNRIRVPLKHGLYTYDYLSESDFDSDGNCNVLSKENLDRFIVGQVEGNKERNTERHPDFIHIPTAGTYGIGENYRCTNAGLEHEWDGNRCLGCGAEKTE